MRKLSILLIIVAMCFCGGVAISVVTNPTIEKIEITASITMKIEDRDRVDIVKVVPDGYNVERGIAWTTSNEGVAVVDENGNIEAIGIGEAIITATYKSLKDTCTVTVLPIDVTSVSVESEYSVIHPQESMQFSANILPSNATYKDVIWESSDPLIATISEGGLVTGVSEGQTIIKATTSGGIYATKTINVKNKIDVQSIKIVGIANTSNLKYGSSYQLQINKEPANADIESVVWESSNISVITVDSNGKISVKKDGSATITATSDNGKTATQYLIVPRVEAKTIKIEVPSGVQQEMLSITINQGDIVKLSVKFYSNNLGSNVTTREIEWTSSDPSKVSVNANGTITAIKKTADQYGDIGVTITAKVIGVSGVSNFIIVHVK